LTGRLPRSHSAKSLRVDTRTISKQQCDVVFITYFPWYQYNFYFISHCVFLRHALQRMKSTKTSLCDKKISQVLWCEMIFIQRVVRFLSPRQGSGIENTQFDVG
jgi:hypothetical protein